MPRKRKDEQPVKRDVAGVVGLRGSVEEQPITETLEINYMPYARASLFPGPSRKLTALSPPTGSCCIPCTKWAF